MEQLILCGASGTFMAMLALLYLYLCAPVQSFVLVYSDNSRLMSISTAQIVTDVDDGGWPIGFFCARVVDMAF